MLGVLELQAELEADMVSSCFWVLFVFVLKVKSDQNGLGHTHSSSPQNKKQLHILGKLNVLFRCPSQNFEKGVSDCKMASYPQIVTSSSPCFQLSV